jgi:hypothetical protein
MFAREQLVFISRVRRNDIWIWQASSEKSFAIFELASPHREGWAWARRDVNGRWAFLRIAAPDELPSAKWVSLLPANDQSDGYCFGRCEGLDVFIPPHIMQQIGDRSGAKLLLVRGQKNRMAAVGIEATSPEHASANLDPRPYDPIIDEPSVAGFPRRVPPQPGTHPHRGRLRAEGRTQGQLSVHSNFKEYEYRPPSRRIFLAQIDADSMKMAQNAKDSMTSGEFAVMTALDAKLPPEWEIYPQPHLGVRQPDFILFHPDGAFVVIEVKDWNLSSYCWESPGVVSPKSARDAFILDPLSQARRVRNRLFDECFPELQDKLQANGDNFFGITRAWAVIPTQTQKEADDFYGREKDSQRTKFELVFGGDIFAQGCWSEKLPRTSKARGLGWTTDMTSRVRAFLRPSRFQLEQAAGFQLGDLTETNRRYARSRRGHTRIEGAAGTGKSTILAARAVEIARSGRRVLMVGYNITMSHWHRDLVQRSNVPFDRSLIDFRHFHGVVADIAPPQTPHEHDESWWVKDGPSIAIKALRSTSDAPAYDAVLIDEIQDFHLSWFRVLEEILTKNAEVVVMADQGQNIYGRDQRWLFDPTAVGGIGPLPFRGPWPHLRDGHRVPTTIVENVLVPFNQKFSPDSEMEPNFGPQVAGAFYHWEDHTDVRDRRQRGSSRIVQIMNSVLAGSKPPGIEEWPSEVPRGDVVVLVESVDVGVQIATTLANQGHGQRLLRLFPTEGEIEKTQNEWAKKEVFLSRREAIDRSMRSRKMAFWAGDGRIKLCTVASFKGWSGHIVVYLAHSPNHRIHFTAFSRTAFGLVVINMAEHLRGGPPWGMTSAGAMDGKN